MVKRFKPVADPLVADALAAAKKVTKRQAEVQMGRPSIYEPRFAEMAEKICRLGATNMQLADVFGVSLSTIENWLSQHREFHDAAHRGLYEGFSPRVVRSLAQQAIGYDIEIEEKKLLANGREVTLKQRKHILPNVAATIFWLKNRLASDWKDVRDHVVQDNNLAKLSSKELLDEIRKEVVELGIIDVDPITGIAKLNRAKH